MTNDERHTTTPAPRRETLLSVRARPREREAWEQAAAAADMRLSEWVRAVLAWAATGTTPGRRVPQPEDSGRLLVMFRAVSVLEHQFRQELAELNARAERGDDVAAQIADVEAQRRALTDAWRRVTELFFDVPGPSPIPSES